ncbi:hypothetical protein KUTeg_003838 [Tegillarca granosa]|uniref:Uncharacterized protein n=1 Tax=Tegillarca granosa TaxID=220873 RepID=A0ABQ9FS17_TEGGR|nr:hypothetical protein KUTeg_003838 [Tegillarca granosa]
MLQCKSNKLCNSAGLDMMTNAMALELGPHQIRFNNVNPTYVPTDMTKEFYADFESFAKIFELHPLKKLAELGDIMYAVLFLLSDKSSIITFNRGFPLWNQPFQTFKKNERPVADYRRNTFNTA